MAKFCKFCGQQLSNENAVFCPKCGKRIAAAPQADYQQTTVPRPSAIQGQPGTNNKLVYGLIVVIAALILGFAGYMVHNELGKEKVAANNSASQASQTEQKPAPAKTQPQAAALPQAPAAAPAPAQAQIDTSLPPATLVVTRSNAAQTVRNYFAAVDAKNYRKAYNMLSSDWRSEFSYDKLSSGYATTIGQELIITSVNVQSDQRATVNFDLNATDRKNGRRVYSYYRGHWDVIPEAGKLVMDNPEIWER